MFTPSWLCLTVKPAYLILRFWSSGQELGKHSHWALWLSWSLINFICYDSLWPFAGLRFPLIFDSTWKISISVFYVKKDLLFVCRFFSYIRFCFGAGCCQWPLFSSTSHVTLSHNVELDYNKSSNTSCEECKKWIVAESVSSQSVAKWINLCTVHIMHSRSEMKTNKKFSKIFWALDVVVVVAYFNPSDHVCFVILLRSNKTLCVCRIGFNLFIYFLFAQ